MRNFLLILFTSPPNALDASREKIPHTRNYPHIHRPSLLSLWEDETADEQKSSRKMSGRGRGDSAIFTEGCCHLGGTGAKQGAAEGLHGPKPVAHGGEIIRISPEFAAVPLLCPRFRLRDSPRGNHEPNLPAPARSFSRSPSPSAYHPSHLPPHTFSPLISPLFMI